MENLIKTEIELSGARTVNANNTTITFQFIPPYPPTLSRYIIGDDFYNEHFGRVMYKFNIISKNNSAITRYGIVISKNINPTINDNSFTVSISDCPYYPYLVELSFMAEDFTSEINTTYYIKPFAENGVGVTYGDERILLVGDINDLNVKSIYSTENINNTLWTKFNYTSKINNLGIEVDWKDAFNDSDFSQEYGYLYKFSDAILLSPNGWKLPDENTYLSLISYLGGVGIAGGKLKDTGTYWLDPNTGATNSARFYGRGASYYYGGFGINQSENRIMTSSRYGQDHVRALALYSNSANATTNRTIQDSFFCSVRLVQCAILPAIAITYNATLITDVTAIFNGAVNPMGYVTVVSFEYGINNSYGSEIVANEGLITGSLMNNMTSNAIALNENTIYHFRIKATNINGISYGNDIEFTTVLFNPEITTYSAIDILETSVNLQGICDARGLDTFVSFEYGETTEYGSIVNPIPNYFHDTNVHLLGKVITGLNDRTIYHYRVVATNSDGTAYIVANDIEFTTASIIETPTATTNDATEIMGSTVTLNGVVNAMGASTVAIFEYGLDDNYGNEISINEGVLSGYDDIPITGNLTGLLTGTLYYFRVTASNSVGIVYANRCEFTTASGAPVLDRYIAGDDFYNETSAGIRHKYLVISDGGGALYETGYVVATHSSPLTSDTKWNVEYDTIPCTIDNGFDANNVELSLLKNTTYYIRPYAINEFGTTYEAERIFVTGGDAGFNCYSTEQIGTQTWIKHNWADSLNSSGSYLYPLYPNNNIANSIQYGCLYKWQYANMIAPNGWHFPTDAECATLSTYLGGDTISGGKLKESSDIYWLNPIACSNSSNFYGRGSGYEAGAYYNFRTGLFIHTSFNHASIIHLIVMGSSDNLFQTWNPDGYKTTLYASVRLIKD